MSPTKFYSFLTKWSTHLNILHLNLCFHQETIGRTSDWKIDHQALTKGLPFTFLLPVELSKKIYFDQILILSFLFLRALPLGYKKGLWVFSLPDFQASFNPFLPCVPYWSPENVTKPNVFWCFHGDQEGTLGRKGFMLI